MRLSEIYTSIQGEGPNTGKPTTFVRFGGCNLRCPGWGTGTLPDGSIVKGCDTVFAVYPEWRGTWQQIDPDQVFDRIPLDPMRVCLTGGEPLTQRSSELNRLAHALIDTDYEIDLFTNGSIPLLDPYIWTQNEKVTVVMDYKLPGSGEYGSFKQDNFRWLQPKDAIKFVCSDRDDFEVALSILDINQTQAQVWFGVVWDKLDHEELAGWIQNDYPEGRMNVQLHKFIWDPEERKV